jgi:predicted membrane protein
MIGISIILKRNYSENEWHFRKKRFAPDEEYINSDDMIDASAIFGSVNKIVMSKNFRGGDVTSIFGGTELNFMKADINNIAVVDVTAIFGGCEIIVPSNWKVKVDITTILGGVEDKRPMELMTAAGSDKILILKGSCIFGGVEIKSYA